MILSRRRDLALSGIDTNTNYIKDQNVAGPAIMDNSEKITRMAGMAWPYMAMNRINIGVYLKNRKNLDHQRKQKSKIWTG